METNDSHRISRVSQCRLLTLRREISDSASGGGELSSVENSGLFPFAIRRAYYIYDVPADIKRGGHSHYLKECLLIAPIGSFTVVVDDGLERRPFELNRPWQALYVPAGIWRELNGFSSGAVVLALASTLFDEADYVRDYKRFLELTANKSKTE